LDSRKANGNNYNLPEFLCKLDGFVVQRGRGEIAKRFHVCNLAMPEGDSAACLPALMAPRPRFSIR
jgi:hypothetical protein